VLDRFTRQDGKSAATFAGFIPVKENAVALKPKKLGIDDFAYLQVSRRRNSHFSSPSANFGDGVDVSIVLTKSHCQSIGRVESRKSLRQAIF
jgi:hypothetical protein